MASKFVKPQSDFQSKNFKYVDPNCWKVKRIENEKRLISLIPKGFPLILIHKKTSRPLVSIHIESCVTDEKSMILKRSKNNSIDSIDSFQCILPNQGQIEFILTNLTESMVNINLMRTNSKVTEVDPGPEKSINQVNEIRGYSSYSVIRDQKTDKTMIVEPNLKDDGEKMMIDECDEVTHTDCFTIFPAVVPCANHNMKDLFQKGETEWISVGTSSFILSFPSFIQLPNTDISEPVSILSRTNNHEETSSIRGTTPLSFRSSSTPSTLERSSIDRGGVVPLSLGVSSSSSPSYGSRSTIPLAPRHPSHIPPPIAPGGNGFKLTQSFCIDASNASNAFATKVREGESVQEHTISTGINYLYDHHSPETYLKISIVNNLPNWPNSLKFSFEDLNFSFERYTMLQYQPKKIYDEDICCICLCESPKDVICTCGHVVHKDCFNQSNDKSRCPICRSRVSLITSVDIFSTD